MSDILPASMFCKSCNCNSSIATRVGFAVSDSTVRNKYRVLTLQLEHIVHIPIQLDARLANAYTARY